MSLGTVKSTCKRIRKVKIQGARNIAIAAAESLEHVTDDELSTAVEMLAQTRPTEPMMRNSLAFIKYKIEEGYSRRESIQDLKDKIHAAYDEIVKVGSERISNGFKIITYCHSSTVTGILKHAASQGKRFEVYCAESRPLYQGRITATELSKHGIPTKSMVDGALRYYVNNMDLAIIGADVITAEGYVINKIGTSMLALAANEAKTEFCVAAELLKFDPATTKGKPEIIEQRPPKEVWPKPGKTEVLNPAFDVTNPEHIDFMITEAGIISAYAARESARERYAWMFR